jgi:hypothetical protein
MIFNFFKKIRQKYICKHKETLYIYYNIYSHILKCDNCGREVYYDTLEKVKTDDHTSIEEIKKTIRQSLNMENDDELIKHTKRLGNTFKTDDDFKRFIQDLKKQHK